MLVGNVYIKFGVLFFINYFYKIFIFVYYEEKNEFCNWLGVLGMWSFIY